MSNQQTVINGSPTVAIIRRAKDFTIGSRKNMPTGVDDKRTGNFVRQTAIHRSPIVAIVRRAKDSVTMGPHKNMLTGGDGKRMDKS